MKLAELSQALSRVVPADAGFAVEDPCLSDEGLYAAEMQYVAKAVPKRRCEFAAGRRAARMAFARVGLPAAPIGVDENRAPTWPEHTVGSISHCDDACIALVARRNAYKAIGIDVEHNTELASDLVESICTSHEQNNLCIGEMSPLRTAKRIFSAKEAAFKAQFGVTGRMLAFHDMTVHFLNDCEFVATFVHPQGDFENGFATSGFSLSLPEHFVHIIMVRQ